MWHVKCIDHFVYYFSTLFIINVGLETNSYYYAAQLLTVIVPWIESRVSRTDALHQIMVRVESM